MQGIQFDEVVFKRTSPAIKAVGGELMSMLDEQVRQPNATDAQFLTKLNKKFGVNGVITLAAGGNTVIRLLDSDYENGQFRVTHYPCEVTYSVEGFLAKHFDEVPTAVERMLQTSTSVILNSAPTVGNERDAPAPVGLTTHRNASFSSSAVRRSQNVNLGVFFRSQLSLLLEQIRLTMPHFVRCIKASEKALATNTGRRASGAGVGVSSATNGLNNPLLNKGKRLGSITASTPGTVAANYGKSFFVSIQYFDFDFEFFCLRFKS